MTKPGDGPAGGRADRASRRIFGRRRGPALSAHQERLLETLLPALTYEPVAGRDPRRAFPLRVRDVWLEVGFGAGEHLLWQAARHPDVGLIGAEPYVSGVAKLLSRLAPSVTRSARDTSPASGGGHAISSLPDHGGGARAADSSFSSPVYGGGARAAGGGGLPHNLRLFTDDARMILDALPDASLGRVFILFPDPWPKTRHYKRRFVQTDTLDILARVMRPGAELRFASDDAGYLNWTLERLVAHPAFHWTARCARDWRARPEDWPPTRYEAKALHGPPAFLRFVRR